MLKKRAYVEDEVEVSGDDGSSDESDDIIIHDEAPDDPNEDAAATADEDDDDDEDDEDEEQEDASDSDGGEHSDFSNHAQKRVRLSQTPATPEFEPIDVEMEEEEEQEEDESDDEHSDFSNHANQRIPHAPDAAAAPEFEPIAPSNASDDEGDVEMQDAEDSAVEGESEERDQHDESSTWVEEFLAARYPGPEHSSLRCAAMDIMDAYMRWHHTAPQRTTDPLGSMCRALGHDSLDPSIISAAVKQSFGQVLRSLGILTARIPATMPDPLTADANDADADMRKFTRTMRVASAKLVILAREMPLMASMFTRYLKCHGSFLEDPALSELPPGFKFAMQPSLQRAGDDEPNDYQQALAYARQMVAQRQLAISKNGEVWSPVSHQHVFVNAYRCSGGVDNLLFELASHHLRPDPTLQYNPFAPLFEREQGKGHTNRLIEYISRDVDVQHYHPDASTFAFENGVYMCDLNRFVDHGMSLPGGRVACNFFSGCRFDPSWCACPPDDIDTPAFDRIFRTQEYTPAEILFIGALVVGRSMRPLKSSDNWQVFPYLRGLAGVGKSCIIDLLTRIIGRQKVFTLSNTPEPNFPLAGAVNKLLLVIPEITNTFSLDQAIFQSCVASDGVTVARKNALPVEMQPWTIPMVGCGNSQTWKNYKDHNGSLARRIVDIHMARPVPPGQGDNFLSDRLYQEIPQIIAKYNRAYLDLVHTHGNANIWDWIPEKFAENRKKLQRASNPVASFLAYSDAIEVAPLPDAAAAGSSSEHDINHQRYLDYYCTRSELIPRFKQYCDRELGDRSTAWSSEFTDGALAALRLEDRRCVWPPRDAPAQYQRRANPNRTATQYILGVRIVTQSRAAGAGGGGGM